jgi:FkbM family methyltransferase
MYRLLKGLALRWLPDSALLVAKRFHYARSLRALDPAVEPDLQIVRRLVSPGNIVLDIGANIGVYTVSLAKWIGDTGKVLAFEPVPPTFDILSSNVRQLGLKNVELFRIAASDTEQSVTMEVPRYPQGGHNYYESRITAAASMETGVRSFTVRAIPIDLVLQGRDLRVDLIKMDVEGHELPALRGAARLLERERPALLVEVSGDPDRSGSPASELMAMLHSLGYSAWWFDGTQLRPRRAADRRSNIFFLRDSHLRVLEPILHS